MSEFHLPSLASDIAAHQCALLLGPEIFSVQGMPVTEAFRQYIRQHHARHLVHVYERENLFRFADEKSKKRVQTEALKGFYEKAWPEEEPLQQLLSLPFHLVLQITPDTFLSDAAHRYSVNHQFKYFSGTADTVEMPTAATPLLYNLCGSRDRYDSTILDYDDLFNFLKAAFGTPGLPENLRTALSECTTFLFVGFELDKWYTQLLSRWVSDKVRGAERWATDYPLGDEKHDVAAFVRHHLEIFTTGKQHRELVRDLYQHFCDEPELKATLRPLSDPVTANTLAVRRQVQQGDLEKALNTFLQAADTIGEKDAATLLLSQYHELKRGRDQYAFSNEQFWERAQNLKFRLLELLNQHAYAL